MKKVFLTGATGFIGSHLAQELVTKGFDVHAIVKYSRSRNTQALKPFLKGVKVINGDLVDYHSTLATLKQVNPDVVVHLAALSPVRDSFEKPFLYVQNNVVATLNIAHAMLELPDYEKKKLIYASTAEVYGIQEKSPCKEDFDLRPSSPYANTKAMTDKYLQMMIDVYKLNCTILRTTNTFGRKLDESFYIESLITSMLKGEKVYVGAPDSIREYLYVDDHVQGYVKAIEKPQVKGVFNIAPGGKSGISNKDLAFKLAKALKYDEKKIVIGAYPPGYPFRPIESDQPFILLDNTKATKQLGWKQTVGFEEGLKRTIAYWKEKVKEN